MPNHTAKDRGGGSKLNTSNPEAPANTCTESSSNEFAREMSIEVVQPRHVGRSITHNHMCVSNATSPTLHLALAASASNVRVL
jgi:hypothetical protein